ncbi:MAG: sigma-70 family RNA polymerase sigma factor [Frankiaceae bacterium]|nr:sigma-70 family RNA polymerase sigma factor [Frankiaceae bacterium]
MHAALAGLWPPDRELLLMVGVDDLTAQEVAVVLGISPEAVRQRLHRVRARLRAQVDAACPT